jgi:hypothetical protein
MPDGCDFVELERARLLAAVDVRANEARELARWMAAHPELALQEHEASARYRAWLSQCSFRVESPMAGMDTAFVATHGSERRLRRCSQRWTRFLIGTPGDPACRARDAARRVGARRGASRRRGAPARGRLPGRGDRARQAAPRRASAFADVDAR